MIEPEVRLYLIRLCDLCFAGKGGECHVPGCAMWLNRAPDLPLNPLMCELMTPALPDQETKRHE